MNIKIKALLTTIGIILSISMISLSAVEKQSSLISKEKKLWEDERIAITLDKIERTDSYPSEFKMPGYRYPPPKEGYDFIVLCVTVTQIKDIHLGMPERSAQTKPTLVDTHGNVYELANVKYTGVEYKEGLTGSDYEIIQGAKGIFLFKTPKNEEPKIFKFVYSYWESWEEKVIKYGQIDIKISQN